MGNFDPIEGEAALQNVAEVNIFHDYFSLYRQKNGKRFVVDWFERNPESLNQKNETIATGYCEAQFSVLRLDKKLTYGTIQVVDVISKKSYLLIDEALHFFLKEECFFCCSIIDRHDYIMTTGVGVPVDGYSLVAKPFYGLKQTYGAFAKGKIALYKRNRQCCSRNLRILLP